MPKTTVTVDTPPSRTSPSKPPRVTVKTRSAKVPSKSPPAAPKTPAKPQPQSATQHASTPATSATLSKSKGFIPEILIGAFVLLLVGIVLFFLWRGATGSPNEDAAAKFEQVLVKEHARNRAAENNRVEKVRAEVSTLEGKTDSTARDLKEVQSKFSKKTEDIEKDLLTLADAMKGNRDQVATDFKALRQEIAKENSDLRKTTGDKIDIVAARLEESVKEATASRVVKEVKAPATEKTPVADSAYSNNASDTRPITASKRSDPTKFEAWELRPGDISQKFCREDIQEGKIEISKRPGIIARNHLSGWGNTWIDMPIPANGNYTPSPQAKFVSFYSQTEVFTIKRLRM